MENKDQQIQEITSSTDKVHLKIFKLFTLGVPKKDIALLLKTSIGAVYNAIKKHQA